MGSKVQDFSELKTDMLKARSLLWKSDLSLYKVSHSGKT